MNAYRRRVIEGTGVLMLLVSLGTALSAQPKGTVVYDFGKDFSNTLNPNGAWSLWHDEGMTQRDKTLLPPTTNNNIGLPGFGHLLGEPSVFLCDPAGTAVCIFPSFYQGLYITWTAPFAASLHITGATFNCCAPAPDMHFSLYVAGVQAQLRPQTMPGIVEYSLNGTLPALPFDYSLSRTVGAGDTVELWMRSLACCGYYAFADLTIAATPTTTSPEPGTFFLMASGIAIVGVRTWRRRVRA